MDSIIKVCVQADADHPALVDFFDWGFVARVDEGSVTLHIDEDEDPIVVLDLFIALGDAELDFEVEPEEQLTDAEIQQRGLAWT